jgi:2-keto-4-pentenoate hydratase/2-oxohepta-3-ene-1,7-dioic acid hydratase in catechol pathway
VKLLTFQLAGGAQHIGALLADGSTVVDLTDCDPARFANMLTLIDGGPAALDAARAAGASGRNLRELAGLRLRAPLPVPRRFRDFLCFEQHFRQSKANRYLFGIGDQRVEPDQVEIPKVWYDRPIYYKGNCHSFVGTDADVHWPSYSRVIDYELELGMVTWRGGKNIHAGDAQAHVFGYVVLNDFSARDEQYTEMQGSLGPSKGKDFDTGNALGPWIATADEFEHPLQLEMVARINGEEWSRGNTRSMGHDFPRMIEYASQEETMLAGELFGSGTVGGGCGNEQGRYMKDGDVIELEITGLGVLRNRIVAPHVPQVPSFPVKILL